ncbi:DUF5000 domain-containing lipoprotein [Mariniphaga sediminis]|uniref:DUF5000 domain-containing lipoprotein n=1 Tax=Mariniphaga sediminis TaxID=1628158 RepID=UPI00356AE000
MKKIIYLILTVALIYACSENEELGQMPLDLVAPGKVTNIQVENMSGGAKLTYELPNDDDLLYVVAKYKVNDKLSREAITSYYDNEIMVNGFGEAKDYEVTLQAVDRSKNYSEPVTVTVSPTTAPLYLAMESIKVIPDFGGINIKWKNETESDLNLVVMVNDTIEEGAYVTEDILYTKVKNGNHSVRGLAAEERDFAILIVDRYENTTDTLKMTLTPLFEMELDPNLFKFIQALTPVGSLGSYYIPERMWDGAYGNSCYISQFPSPYEVKDGLLYVTMDLGKRSKISRCVYWPRGGDANFIYNHFNVKRYAIWGSNDPAPDAFSFEGWTKINDFTVEKPSGLPLGQISQEDKDAADRGHEGIFPLESEAYRYIRFQVLETWSGGSLIQVGELKFFGQYEE